MKTKEQIREYNKAYSKRPEVKEWARVRNARPGRKVVRKLYKQTVAAKRANYKYRTKPEVKEKVKRRRLELRYGITYEQFIAIYEFQCGMCAICSKLVKDLHVDHDHKNGKVRGLLCGSCNRGLGMFADSPNLMREAINYLNKHV